MPLKTHLDEQPSLNLTPMIDVVFLLIIFFMVGTKFTELEQILALKVPQVSDAQPLAPAPRKRVVCVYGDGTITLDRDAVTLQQLHERLAAAHSQYESLGVIVRGDAEGAFQNIANVLSTIRQAGIADMSISVRLARREP